MVHDQEIFHLFCWRIGIVYSLVKDKFLELANEGRKIFSIHKYWCYRVQVLGDSSAEKLIVDMGLSLIFLRLHHLIQNKLKSSELLLESLTKLLLWNNWRVKVLLELLSFSLHKIGENKGFHWPVLSCKEQNRRFCPYTENKGQEKPVFSHNLFIFLWVSFNLLTIVKERFRFETWLGIQLLREISFLSCMIVSFISAVEFKSFIFFLGSKF